MNCRLKKILVTSMLSILSIVSISVYSFADEGDEQIRHIPKGEGEISIMDKSEGSGTLNDPYKSTLSMGDQQINGISRSYKAGTHQFSMKIEDRTNYDGPNKCKIKIQKTILGMGSDVTGEKTYDLGKRGNTTYGNFGYLSSATYRYVYDNRASRFGNDWSQIDWFKARPVEMYSN